jgi:hypothetical protein
MSTLAQRMTDDLQMLVDPSLFGAVALYQTANALSDPPLEFRDLGNLAPAGSINDLGNLAGVAVVDDLGAGRPVNVLFVEAPLLAEFGASARRSPADSAQTAGPHALALRADVPAVAKGETLTIGESDYYIITVWPEADGLVRLDLSLDPP